MTPTAHTPNASATSLKRTVGVIAAAVVLAPGAGVALAFLSLPFLAVVAAVTATSLAASSLIAAAGGSGGSGGGRGA